MDTVPLLIFQCLNGVVWGLIFAMIVLGLSLTFGLMNLMNVAHGSFYMLGAMLTATFVSVHGLNFVLSVVLSVAIVTVVGIIINRLVLDRVVGAEPLIGLLATAGLLLVIDSCALALFGSASISVDDPLSASIEIFGTFYPVYRLVVAGCAIAAITGVFCFLRFTKQGLWMRAVPESRDLSLMAGVSPKRVNRTTIILGSFLAALAGALVTPIASAQFQMGLAILGTGFIVVVVGGAKNLLGTVTVAIALGVVRGIAATFVAPTEAEVISLVVLLPLLVIWPNGIFGGRHA
ncbi:branched-chain amino acid ABC transporter permease [Bradyrhizobium sp.]|jgi:branched-chain amino acid transport system permease protein|uniref:branched-chain amino acid ABC transporter permease n=1 Tax=Bradyrhizobium sp. TaxID=376 RepID=UPI003D10EC12